MITGVAPGGSLSSALFDMGIVPSIRRAKLANPSTYLIADDNMVVGLPVEAIAAVTLLPADVGLTLAATTDSKNVIYELGTQYTDAQCTLVLASDLHWIPSSHGLLVHGTPIGGNAYMIEHINTTVHAIIY